ncbi:LysR family transcriptional regulator [Noviherbaspirillum aerium]|uniref:LysR family transcriptional regulator n=1 Tax=Noviherbaspirillum aerium TaxID=2588497 RepID=UPI0021F4F4AC|nr:LysR family transcriptional regulator [Noviherbaspirillum aerium]
MKAFVTVVDAGSFAAAAERMQISRAMASKHVATLEDHLGTRLLNRTTRRLSLTEAGTVFYERSVQIMADLSEAEQVAGYMAAAPRGVLKIAMPLSFGQHRLGPLIAGYVRTYPQVKLDIALSDRKVDLVDEGFDLAIRIGMTLEPGLIARKLGDERIIICGAPSYLEQHGIPRTPKELAGHACLGYALGQGGDEWRLEGPGGPVSVRCSGPIRADNGDMLREAAVNGAGLIFQPRFIVGADLQAGRLKQVLEEYQSGEMGIYAVYSSRKHLSAKVRSFVDFLAAGLGLATPPA